MRFSPRRIMLLAIFFLKFGKDRQPSMPNLKNGIVRRRLISLRSLTQSITFKKFIKSLQAFMQKGSCFCHCFTGSNVQALVLQGRNHKIIVMDLPSLSTFIFDSLFQIKHEQFVIYINQCRLGKPKFVIPMKEESHYSSNTREYEMRINLGRHDKK